MQVDESGMDIDFYFNPNLLCRSEFGSLKNHFTYGVNGDFFSTD